MDPEARKDELKMSWNKKVSLREIAQFYEDRLRELDAKQNNLINQIDDRLKSLESKIDSLSKYIDRIIALRDENENIKNEVRSYLSEIREDMKRINDIRTTIMSTHYTYEKKTDFLRDKLIALALDLNTAKAEIGLTLNQLILIAGRNREVLKKAGLINSGVSSMLSNIEEANIAKMIDELASNYYDLIGVRFFTVGEKEVDYETMRKVSYYASVYFKKRCEGVLKRILEEEVEA